MGFMPSTTRVAVLVGAVTLAVVLLAATGPPAPVVLPADGTKAVRGAFHIHTTRSDGALPKAGVAAAAARAGLAFAVFTDHGDGTRPPDPPEYLHGVLCVDGVEISTNDGHYIALDLPATPYPLRGDGSAVAEDVRRLGGFGIAAHPWSPREDLAWSDWAVPIDGLEWLNADSEWRDEGGPRLARALVDYLWRPAAALAALLDRPARTLAAWDDLAASRPVVALAGHDAHGGIGAEGEEGGGGGRRLHVPSYEATFRAFSLYVDLDAPLGGEAAADAERLVSAIRNGQIFTGVDALASPATLQFRGTSAGVTVTTGGRLPAGPTARFSVRSHAPPGATTRLLRNGVTVAEAHGGVVHHEDSEAGAYRAEVVLAGRRGGVPWVLSNPIYWLDETTLPSSRSGLPEGVDAGGVAAPQAWRVEASAGSAGTVEAGEHEATVFFRLQPEGAASPFVALAIPLEALTRPDRLAFRGRADRPMRVSVQLRFTAAEARWARSVYLDAEEREVQVPIDNLRPAATAAARPPLSQATSLLFVVDLTNARPGDTGQFTIGHVAFQQPGATAPGASAAPAP